MVKLAPLDSIADGGNSLRAAARGGGGLVARGAARRCRVFRNFDVFEHGVDLPLVAVGVADPELVLPRVAAGRVLLVETRDAARGQALLPGLHLAGGAHPQSEVGQRALRIGPAAGLVQREVDRRVTRHELDVARLLLGGRNAEESGVEAAGEISSEGRRVGTQTLSDATGLSLEMNDEP